MFFNSFFLFTRVPHASLFLTYNQVSESTGWDKGSEGYHKTSSNFKTKQY